MRRLRLIPALLVILLSACNEKLIEQSPVDSTQTGEITVSLSSDLRTSPVKSGGDDVDMDNFWIEIFNSREIRLFSQQYNSAKEQVIKLNAGEYRLLAKLGDSLGVGFDKAFYMADEPFTVHGQTKETVHAVARLANVKAAVIYGENIRRFYSEGYYAVLRHASLQDRSLKFVSDETRAGYIPAGDLVLEVYAKIEGKWKYYVADALPCSPNDFVTFNVDTGSLDGELVINVLIDNSVETIEKNVEISSDVLSAEPPFVSAIGFDGQDSSYIPEGSSVSSDNLSVSYSAKAGVASCVLDIESEYLAGLGLPSSVDFTGLSAEDSALLEKAGFFWASNAVVGVVDFAGILPGLGANSVYMSRDAYVARFTLTVTDLKGREAGKTLYIKVSPDAKAEVIIPEYDVWARRIVTPHVVVAKGNQSLFTLEYSTDGISWTSLEQQSISGNTLEFNTLNGLIPSTEYQFRAMYDGWIAVSDVMTVRTEAAAQVGNAGFEDWTEQTHTFTPLGGIIGGSPTDFKYYRPWVESDRWWDVNAKVSMPSSSTGWTSANVKCFPCTGSSVDSHSGSYSALAIVVNVGGTNTNSSAAGTNYVGEIYIGTADDSGNHATEAHAFASRPTGLKFHYKYAPRSNESFAVKIDLRSSDGTVLASSEVTGGAASEWTEFVLPLDYSELRMKAAEIYISFKASANAGGVNSNTKIEMGGGSYTGHFGSQLRIDDVELIYE